MDPAAEAPGLRTPEGAAATVRAAGSDDLVERLAETSAWRAQNLPDAADRSWELSRFFAALADATYALATRCTLEAASPFPWKHATARGRAAGAASFTKREGGGDPAETYRAASLR